MVYQYEIVHITHIVLYTEPLFYVVVEVVKHGKSDELRHLGAEPYTDFTERVYNFASPLRYLRVFNPLADSRFRYIVAYAREIMVYITFQYPPLRTVFVIISP